MANNYQTFFFANLRTKAVSTLGPSLSLLSLEGNANFQDLLILNCCIKTFTSKIIASSSSCGTFPQSDEYIHPLWFVQFLQDCVHYVVTFCFSGGCLFSVMALRSWKEAVGSTLIDDLDLSSDLGAARGAIS